MPGVTDVLVDGDSRLWLLGPSRTLKQLLTKWKDLKVDLGVFGSGTLTVTIHQAHVDASDGGDDAVATDFGWTGTQGLWSLDYYHRGTRVFSGPIQTVHKRRDGGDGTAYLTLTAEMWLPALLRRRQVRTEYGTPFTVTNDSWRDIARKLVEEQCEFGRVVTPTGWQQNAEVRNDFGAFTVTVTNVSDSGSEDYQVDVRTNLWDAVCELCNMPSSTDDKLWPSITETSAGTFNIDFLIGRSGVGRAIGTDRTDSVRFSSRHGNLLAFELVRDGAATENHIVSGGAGPGSSQSTRHAANDTSITTRNLGVYEGVEDVPGGVENYIQDNELRRVLYERADIRTWRCVITETATQYWPTSFDIKDSVTIYDHTFDETVAAQIVGVQLTYPAPGPYQLALVFGNMMRNELRAIGRAGGGGGGGRGGGGSSRNHDGKRYVYEHIVDSAAVEIAAHEFETGLKITGEASDGVLKNVTAGTDNTAWGTDDELEVVIYAPFRAGTSQGPAGYVPANLLGGGTVWLLATNVDPFG